MEEHQIHKKQQYINYINKYRSMKKPIELVIYDQSNFRIKNQLSKYGSLTERFTRLKERKKEMFSWKKIRIIMKLTRIQIPKNTQQMFATIKNQEFERNDDPSSLAWSRQIQVTKDYQSKQNNQRLELNG